MKTGVCNYLYGRDVKATGKFCAGGVVDACQVREGGLQCTHGGHDHGLGKGLGNHATDLGRNWWCLLVKVWFCSW